MSPKQTPASASELVEELSAFAAGGGMLTFVLAPFALPMLALVAVVAIVAGLAALVATFIVAFLCAPILVAVRLGRRHRIRPAEPLATLPADANTRTPPRTRTEGGPNMSEILTVEAGAHASADPATLWALLEDVNRYKDWGPWSESGYLKQPGHSLHGAGAVRRLRYRHRRAATIEPVIEAIPEQQLVYEVTSGLPVRNYRAIVELTRDDRGTRIRWRATFDRTFGGLLVRRVLARVYREILDRLVAAAEAERTVTPDVAISSKWQ
jgi:Polyketide cyclase / dehydrase and lipid transport